MQGTIKFTCKGCGTSKTVKGNVFPTNEGLYSMQAQIPFDHTTGRRWVTFKGEPICTKCDDRLSEALQGVSLT